MSDVRCSNGHWLPTKDWGEQCPYCKEERVMNASGMWPVEYKCLVKPDKVDEMIGSIYVPPAARDKQQMAEVKSTLVATGGNAFDGWEGLIPRPGDKVYVAKYAGMVVKGEDNEEYRLVNDKDIAAVIEVSND